MTKFITKIDPTLLVPKTTARHFYYGAFWITIAQILILASLWKYVPKVVPLFFTEPWGEARLASKIFLVILPTASLLSVALNLIVGRVAKEESPLLSYCLAVSSLVIVVMFTIALSGILQSVL